jgi:hypothetical protein
MEDYLEEEKVDDHFLPSLAFRDSRRQPVRLSAWQFFPGHFIPDIHRLSLLR